MANSNSEPPLAPIASNGTAASIMVPTPIHERSIGMTRTSDPATISARVAALQDRRNKTRPLEPEAQRPVRQADLGLGDERRGRDFLHRAARLGQRRRHRAHPLQIRGVPAVQGHGQEARWRQPIRTRAGADVAGEQLLGNRRAERGVRVSEVAAEQLVELRVVVGRMVVAVPPEPVAAFGDQDFLQGPIPRRRRRPAPARASKVTRAADS